VPVGVIVTGRPESHIGSYGYGYGYGYGPPPAPRDALPPEQTAAMRRAGSRT